MKQLIGFLVLVGLVLAYWQWIVGIVLVVLIIRALPVALREWQAEQAAVQAARKARDAALVARADREHAQVMAGDERGIWGQYPPAVYEDAHQPA